MTSNGTFGLSLLSLTHAHRRVVHHVFWSRPLQRTGILFRGTLWRERHGSVESYDSLEVGLEYHRYESLGRGRSSEMG